MNNQIKVEKDKLLGIYKDFNCEQKALLEHIFGSEIFKPKDIKERVKTFEDACNILGNDNQAVIDYYAIVEATCTEDIIAFAKLRVIAEALNEGWKPKFDAKEYRYYPWFHIYSKYEYDELLEEEKEECRVVVRSVNYARADGGVSYVSADIAASNSYANSGYLIAFKTRELAEYCGNQFIDIWVNFLFA